MRRTANNFMGAMVLLSLAAIALLATPLCAHPESVSTVQLQLRARGAAVSLTLQIRDLTAWFPPGKQSVYMPYVIRGLRAEASGLFELQADEKAVLPTDVAVHSDKPGCVRVDLFFPFPSSTQLLMIRSNHLGKLPAGHQQLLCAEDARMTAKPTDEVRIVLEQAISADQDFAEISMPDPPSSIPSGATSRTAQ